MIISDNSILLFSKEKFKYSKIRLTFQNRIGGRGEEEVEKQTKKVEQAVRALTQLIKDVLLRLGRWMLIITYWEIIKALF